MANEWNVAYPVDHTLISDVPGEIRKLKASAKTQIDHEHETPVDGDATGGEHMSGSGVGFEGTATPTTRPGGANLANNAIDRGRLWFDDNFDPPKLMRWAGAAFEAVQTTGGIDFTPAAYAAEESVTLPNGLVLKFGYGAGTPSTITFGAAFGTAGIAGLIVLKNATAAMWAVVTGLTTTALTAAISGGAPTGYYWVAIGY